MAKKSVKLGLRSGSAVESGDVNVTYNGVRIAGLSESTTATLETENTIVEHDIEIEYMKPAGGSLERTYPVYLLRDDGTTAQSDLTGSIGHDVLIPFAELSGASPAYVLYMGNSDVTWMNLEGANRIPFEKKTLGNKGFIIIMPNLEGYESPEFDRILIYDPTER